MNSSRHMILASGIQGMEGFRQRWSLHGRLEDTKYFSNFAVYFMNYLYWDMFHMILHCNCVKSSFYFVMYSNVMSVQLTCCYWI